MTDILPDEGSSSLRDGLRFLRSSALSAHAAGDGFVVNHICRVALRAISRAIADSSGPLLIDLEDVRWVFCLWLHWLLDYELVIEAVGRLTLHGLLDRLPKSQHSQHDFIVISNLFSFLSDPSSPFPVRSALELPEDWFEHRSKEPEDIALLSLSAEFAWFSNNNSPGVPWRNVVDNWLTKCPQGAPLATALETLRRRLSRSPKSFAHSNRDELMLVIPLFLATCGLWSDPDDPASFVGGRLFSIGPHFTAVFSRFRAVLRDSP